jgi:aspartyl/asparaginyl beta-hydroxylase (cupin superfamily)
MSGFIDYREYPPLLPLVDELRERWPELLREAVGAIEHFVPSPEINIQDADDIRLYVLPIKWRGAMADQIEQLGHGEQILEAVPLAVRLAQHPLVPSVQFSMSMPGCELISHIDNESHIGDVLRLHLGLSCPADCALTVDGESREWSDGEVLVFDSAHVLHSAHNRGTAPRLILILDVDRQALAAWQA